MIEGISFSSNTLDSVVAKTKLNMFLHPMRMKKIVEPKVFQVKFLIDFLITDFQHLKQISILSKTLLLKTRTLYQRNQLLQELGLILQR
jgi:hypothetical protein